jgi:hypothetical protein
VNAEFFVLAFTAAFNPKLIAVDLLLIENSRPRAMFLSILGGGMSVAVAIGLLLLVLCGLLMTRLIPRKHSTADLAALHNLIAGKYSTFLRRSQAWLAGHVRQLAAWICGLLGVYLVISAPRSDWHDRQPGALVARLNGSALERV